MHRFAVAMPLVLGLDESKIFTSISLAPSHDIRDTWRPFAPVYSPRGLQVIDHRLTESCDCVLGPFSSATLWIFWQRLKEVVNLIQPSEAFLSDAAHHLDFPKVNALSKLTTVLAFLDWVIFDTGLVIFVIM